MGSIRVDVGSIAKRTFLPSHFFRWMRLKKQAPDRSMNDAQLKLYSKILGSPYLHFGYFEDPLVSPSEVSLADLTNAQIRYAELLVQRVLSGPVLDAGCGVGGLSRTLKNKGFEVLSLTPDINQVEWIRRHHPDLSVVKTKFEDFSDQRFIGAFSCVLMSESFQYMNLERSIRLASGLLKNNGRWIVCDYFRTATGEDRTGHLLSEFYEKVHHGKFVIQEDLDLTENVLPTLAVAKLMGERLVAPFLEFIEEKLESKKPRLHYVFEEFFGQLSSGLHNELHRITPGVFFENRQYRLIVLEKSS